jgi:hypothetical protein
VRKTMGARAKFERAELQTWDAFSDASLVFVNGRLLGRIDSNATYPGGTLTVRFLCPVPAGSLVEFFDPQMRPGGHAGQWEFGQREQYTLDDDGRLHPGVAVEDVRRLVEGDDRMASGEAARLEYKREFQDE